MLVPANFPRDLGGTFMRKFVFIAAVALLIAAVGQILPKADTLACK